MERPYKVPLGNAIGVLALLLSIGLIILYLPGSPAALLWPEEWAIVIAWAVLGLLFFGFAKRNKKAG